MNRTHTFLLLTFSLISYSLFGQIIWTEDFDTGSSARGTLAAGYPCTSGGNWTQTNIGAQGGSANNWYVSGEECGNATGACGSQCTNGDGSLHVSAIGGLCGTPDCGAAYDETGPANATHKRIESPVISTVGSGGLTLNFNYIAAQGDDGVIVVISTNGGATWNPISIYSPFTTIGATQCCDCNIAFLCGCCFVCCGGFTVCAGGTQGRWTAYSYPLPAIAENIANLKVGFEWLNDGNGVGTDPSIAVDDMNITRTVVLPVELSLFTGSMSELENKIHWETSSEVNNSHFEIQRSIDGKKFIVIGRQDGVGNSQELQTYDWRDAFPNIGENYYRLKQVDMNGEFQYSQTILLKRELLSSSGLRVFPNPVVDRLSVVYYSENGLMGSLEITDLSGRVISSETIQIQDGRNEYEVSTADLLHGNYIVRILNEQHTRSMSFAK